MGNVSTDQKLQLVQMIRAENQDNRLKMRSREKMLYGTEINHEVDELPLYMKGYYSGRTEKELNTIDNSKEKINSFSFSSFKLRLVLAVILFAGFLMLDAGYGSIPGFTTKQLHEEINKDFDNGLESIVFDFEHNFPYTLFNGDK